MKHTDPPWTITPHPTCFGIYGRDGYNIATVTLGYKRETKLDEKSCNARLIAAAPDHALIGWAMCVQDGRWEELGPHPKIGEFIFCGIRHVTSLDEFGCPILTEVLRESIIQAQRKGE